MSGTFLQPAGGQVSIPPSPPSQRSSGRLPSASRICSVRAPGCRGTARQKPTHAAQGRGTRDFARSFFCVAETVSEMDYFLLWLPFPSAILMSITHYFQRSGFYKTNIWVSRFIICPRPHRRGKYSCVYSFTLCVFIPST